MPSSPERSENAEQRHERGGITEQSKLVRTEITRYPNANQQPDPHTHDFVGKEPADVAYDFLQVVAAFESFADKRGKAPHPDRVHVDGGRLVI